MKGTYTGPRLNMNGRILDTGDVVTDITEYIGQCRLCDREREANIDLRHCENSAGQEFIINAKQLEEVAE